MIHNDTASVYTDFSGFGELRAAARKNSSGAIKEVARQFEGMFLQMMIKSMRDASLGEGIFDNNQTGMVRDMYDQQLALSLAGRNGIGLSKALERQLGQAAGVQVDQAAPVVPRFTNDLDSGIRHATPVIGDVALKAAPVAAPVLPDVDSETPTPQEFVQGLMPLAKGAADSLGTDPEVLVAQAALETGWGKSVIRNSDGGNSHNLFGIKADSRWQGDRVTVSTLEYEQGVPVRKKEQFRAYGSYEQSFEDYADFIRTNPRYQQALDAAGDAKAYTQGLQDAGYATDPEYARKIINVMDGKVMTVALDQMG